MPDIATVLLPFYKKDFARLPLDLKTWFAFFFFLIVDIFTHDKILYHVHASENTLSPAVNL